GGAGEEEGVAAAGVSATETAPRPHDEVSRATRGSPPPAMWKAVSVAPLDRGSLGSGQKSPGVPLVESAAFPKTRQNRGVTREGMR
ncbi:hypothetical protein V500_10304, partial [Pseudogymnoascus sp. VKM F-4518 (FW-2643)]